jgi:microcystin-dependent protein
MGNTGYLTPNSAAMDDVICRRIVFPNDPLWRAIITGMVSELTYSYNYEKFGTLTPDECAVLGQEIFEAYMDSECMIGAIFPYVTTNPPPNCIPCDGGTYNRTDYPRLYALLDAQYITGPDTFVTPDMSDQFPMGASATNPAGTTGGASTVELTANQNGSHSHTTQPHTHTSAPHSHSEISAIAAAAMPPAPPLVVPSAIPGIAVTGPTSVIIDSAIVTVDDSGSGEAHENKPPFTAFNYCILAR